MKRSSILLLPILMVSCLLGVRAKAEYAEIEKASEIISEFRVVLVVFLNKKNTEKIDAHIDRFAKIAEGIDSLTCAVRAKYEKTGSVKEEAFLSILKDIQFCVKEVYSALTTKSVSKVLIAFKKHTSRKFLKSIRTKLENTKKYLTENETKLVNSILATADNILKEIPASEISCAIIIKNAVGRQ
jgi:hypothetical protein